MNVLVDTSVWSLALRRVTPQSDQWTDELSTLVEAKSAFLIGPIRQELLSGIRENGSLKMYGKGYEAFPDLAIEETDYESGADFYNRCRAGASRVRISIS